MNLKVANLIAVQFGILVGIMSWLAYSRFESAEPRIAAVEMRKRPVDSVAAVASISEPGSQLSRALDYGADPEQDQAIAEQPAPAAHQYSAEAVQQYTALAAQQYYQQIAPRRYASSRVENRSVAADSLSYAEVNRDPAVVPADYAESPQPNAYAEPAQIVYSQPVQYVVFSNSRRFANRCRPPPPPDVVTPVAHSGSGRRGPHRNVCDVGPRRNPNVPSCRPSQGFKSWEKR
jgi:hypothetical protein